MSLNIIGMGKGIPKKQVTNDEIANYVDTNDEWIQSRTGIQTRHVCTSETLSDLAATASLEALENAKLTVSDIDLFICATIGGELRTPSLSCTTAEKIGLKCTAFDINAACTGFAYALEVAVGYFAMGKAKNILITCGEMMSTQLDWNDRNTCVLFGDGAAACVVTPGDSMRYISLTASPDSTILRIPLGTGNTPFLENKVDEPYLYMQGQDVFKFAVGVCDVEVSKALEALSLAPEDVDWFLLHQANKRIIDGARRKLKQPEEKFPTNIEKYGNLSSVSIPLLLYELVEDGKVKAGDTIVLSAFGAGMTAGTAVFKWQ
jgi:3-oxoacyl-[acyl-carrier-protein] synthase-3